MNKFEFTKYESEFTGTHVNLCFFILHSMDKNDILFSKSLNEKN